jgi:hypothetical protein
VAILKLSTQKEWKLICKNGKKPNGVPSDPYAFYAKSGWKGWADFLGKEES